MPFRLVVVLLLVLGASRANADSEVLAVDPPAGPPAPAVAPRVGFYGEMFLGYGLLQEELDFPSGRMTTQTDARSLRWALGARVAAGDMDIRLGGVIDVVHASSGEGAAIGLELQMDWPLVSGWRAGGRGSLSTGNGDGTPTTLDGVIGSAGLRLRKDYVIVGLDGMRVWNDHGHATGAMLTVGFGGRPGKYLVGVSAATTAVLGAILIGVMSTGSTH